MVFCSMLNLYCPMLKGQSCSYHSNILGFTLATHNASLWIVLEFCFKNSPFCTR